jgi:hypothetical protein
MKIALPLRNGPWSTTAIQIWPDPATAVWPPETGFDPGTIADFIDRFRPEVA